MKRLLYISEVPVELSYAGATLLYRLFEGYTADKLTIVQTGLPTTGRRLKDVTYIQSSKEKIRLLGRLRNYTGGTALNIWSKRQIGRRLAKTVAQFCPEAVISVTFGLSWLTAEAISRRHGIPLFLVLHDDLLSTENFGREQGYIGEKFRQAYVHAAECFCIGPQMERYYFERYGRKGAVLYPSRGMNDKTFRVDWLVTGQKRSLNFCYAGSIGTPDFIPMLDTIAALLGQAGHTLTIFSKIPDHLLAGYGHFRQPHVTIRPLVHPDELKEYLKACVDVNVLLNSFDQEQSFRLNFSSKIVDYTAVDLPVLFWGAPSSGIYKWFDACNYPCLITEKSGDRLAEEIGNLEKAAYRKQLADQLQVMADATFGFERNFTVLKESINGVS